MASLLHHWPAAAQPRRHSDPNPDATLEIELVHVGLLVLGGSFGGGRLHFRGKDYAVKISGIEVGSLGLASVSASGEIFGLKRLEDFPGNYQEEPTASAPEGSSGPHPLRLRNAAGVLLRLRSQHEGALLRIAPAGLDAAFQD
ncbi:DUF1134 domain-containing protein [Pseudoroseomonas ludipueritiae]|uniref:DUF1134 domain-containing protein n=1 Tax=Pseudoroseomonas ludipueritiae TaxID=198093 RepID=A0ABR7R1R2_9PROT|nr:DUF1134 domain-containing protein [Pseudoroseomonas ludipueritiae]MBC9175673.1 DUF1134 domain-containing protein [Pseudoroseomonas ludipueritiae]MCG7360382.1 hypothetical protein [Roseomonas sp. ACRSG]